MKKAGMMIYLLFCIGMILSASVMGIYYGKSYLDARKSYQKAEQYVERQQEFPEEAEKEINTQTTVSKKKESQKRQAPVTVDFQSLKAVNPDMIGWLYIESVGISYPILKGADNDYYLHRTWERKENFAGSIFMDYRNSSDFSDYNTVIYGHNMKDGSMFHKTQYVMTEENYEKNPYIWVVTPEETFRYKIFTSYDTRYDSDTYSFFWHPGKKLEAYIQKMKEQSLWEGTGKLQGDEHILTLSTCNGLTDIRRIVQAARE